MDILLKIAQLLVSLSLLVIVHEFGHFIFAKIFKCRVEKFYLFFNPWFSLAKWKWGETDYGIGWVPFGGYVKIAGMVDESMDTEQLKQPPQPWEYRSKPAWQRLLIIVAGVMMNVILAMIIYIGMTYAWGTNYIKNEDVKNGYAFTEYAHNLGFRDGDKIISVGGEKIDDYMLIPQAVLLNTPRTVEIDRDGRLLAINIPDSSVKTILKDVSLIAPMLRYPFVIENVIPDGYADKAGLVPGDSLIAANGLPVRFFDQYKNIFAQHADEVVLLTFVRNGLEMTREVLVSDAGIINVEVALNTPGEYKISTQRYGFFESIPVGIKRGATSLGNYVKQLKLIASPETEAYKSVGGFITMGNIFPSKWNWVSFWHITAMLSIMLAVINILPIPALDGGHMVFILYEMVTRRTPSQKFMETAQIIGFIIIVGIVLLANGNDILRLFIK